MGNRIRSHLTFANVIAVVALFLALGGSVYAAGKLNGKTIKRNSLPGNRLKGDSVTGREVNEASLGAVPNAANATNATNATSATNAASAQPVAFAHVLSDGTLETADSKNVGAAVRQEEGLYCISGLPFTPRGAQATVDAVGSESQFAQVGLVAQSEFDCPGVPGAQVFVDTFDTDTGSFSDAPFFVVLYG
jgi:hypothetical protein